VPLDLSAGDAIVFDFRTFHAGSANNRVARRAMLYLVYARPWYDDALHRRLLVDLGYAESGARAPSLVPSGLRLER
jgi:ectoine hydroxylase-related dioxygenase (phytanoyl-CoA dioxygenase family)